MEPLQRPSIRIFVVDDHPMIRHGLAAMIKVPIARPRNQLTTKEHPEFLKLRRELYQFLGHH